MRLRYQLFSLLFLLLGGTLTAQDCLYQVVLEDELGDGWNGAELTVRTNQIFRYTLSEEDGDRAVFFFPITDGQPINVDLTPGAFPEEISFSLFDNADSLLFRSGPPAVTGNNLFAYSAVCKTCVPPATNGIDIFRVRSSTVDIRFNRSSLSTNPQYLIEYGPGEYDPATDGNGLTITTQDTFRRITELIPDLAYTFWLSTICQTEDDTTSRRGPFPIRTQKAADVGITELPSPATGCNLGSEEVTIGITNFGGEAQAFFDVNFSINGGEPIAQKPNDGIFTGVVGVDSTEYFTFDAGAFLGAPGTYTITAWATLEEDEDRSNDTMEFTVVHVPQIANFPYHENFEESDGFWYSERAGRGISSWRWGEPFATFIDRAPNGERAWVTNPGGDYNDRELSYLLSPCFDFSGMAADPLFSAILRVRTETDFDGAWLEMTRDDGANWEKVVNSPAATGWYNDLFDQVWEGDGGFGDRAMLISNLLPAAAGDTVQLRFVFQSSRSDTDEGILVDAVTIGPRADANLAGISVVAADDCGVPPTYDFTVANAGTVPVDSFRLGFPAGTSAVYNERILPGNQITVPLSPLSGLGVRAGASTPVWVIFAGDTVVSNDTAYLAPTMSLPFYEDFSNGRTPDLWDLGTAFSVGIAPLSFSNALVASLDGDNPDGTIITTSYGEFVEMDTLRFTIELSNRDGGDFTGKASLDLSIFQCDIQSEIFMIDSLENREYAIALSDISSMFTLGQIIFTFSADMGDFTLAIDDITVARCPEALGLIANVVGVSSSGATDAIASVTPTLGISPFRYVWSTGDNEQQVDGLAEGPLSVTVIDAVGCQDSVFFTVDQSTAAEDPDQLLAGLNASPNPTTEAVTLRLELPEVRSLQASVFDLTGRQLLFQDFGRQRLLNERIDFSAFPTGVYLLRLQTEDAARTLRVIRR